MASGIGHASCSLRKGCRTAKPPTRCAPASTAKYALGLELTDAGFDYSVLSEFRARLVAGSAEGRLLDVLVAACVQQGYLKARGKQRTDSTHVLAAVRMLYRLERVAETLRATLNALATDRARLAAHPGQSGLVRPLRATHRRGTPPQRAAGAPHVCRPSRRGWATSPRCRRDPRAPEQCARRLKSRCSATYGSHSSLARQDGGFELCDPKALPKASEILESPYESEARYAVKRGRSLGRVQECI